MDEVLNSFIAALRNADVRISTAETLDAYRVTELVGYSDRNLLKDALALTLAKTQDEKAAFDECFDRFFSFRSSAPLAPPATARAADETDRAPGEGQGGGGDGSDRTEASPSAPQAAQARTSAQHADASPPTRDDSASSGLIEARSALGQLLMRGNELEINIAIADAGRQVRVHEIQVFTQKSVYVRRIMDAMGAEELRQEIARLEASASSRARSLGHELGRRRDWLRERVRDFVERQFLLHADVAGRRLREDLLRTMRLTTLEQRHHRELRKLVQRMAKRLAAAHSTRRKTFRSGQLHVPKTLRGNMRYDDAIFDLKWRSRKVDRSRILAICDVSGSVADYARFMLMFLYSLDEVLPDVRSFAFSSSLGETSDLFARNDLDDAIALALREYGGGSTDYGQALADFRRLAIDDVDARTTVIILGDARNNYGDLRTDILKEVYERARRVIWLNPESRALWDTGDSEMRHYAPWCHDVEECGTLAQLERFVSRLLRIVA